MGGLTLVEKDFKPDENTVKILIAWGRFEKNPCGDKLIDEEFITREDIRLEFITYWLNDAIPSKAKKKNWQKAFQNGIKIIYWPRELRDFEYNRHKRPKHQQGGNAFVNVLNSLQPPRKRIEPVIIERTVTPTGRPTNPEEALRQLALMTGSRAK